MTLVSAAILLFLVMDPMGNVPFFITALKDVPEERHRRVVIRELLIALAAMIIFLFAGQSLLGLLRISEPALTIAGGIILFLIAVRMIFPSEESDLQERLGGEPFIVPLAIPYVAGPSVLATELLLMSREPQLWWRWLIALLLAWFVSSVILYFGSSMRRFLGERGLVAATRLMGMVLTTIAVQMVLDGLRVAFDTSRTT
ncbi:MAG: NAAT family transporter [Gemmataceae bacterium]|nr:NAAT family transporter [Gemmataceae bacterium]